MRFLLILLMAVLLVACGTSGTSTGVSSPAAPTALPAETSPEATVQAALTTIKKGNEAALLKLYDASMVAFAPTEAHTAVEDWRIYQKPVDPGTGMRLGPISSEVLQPIQLDGGTATQVLHVEYQIGYADWTFQLTKTDGEWKLISARAKKKQTQY